MKILKCYTLDIGFILVIVSDRIDNVINGLKEKLITVYKASGGKKVNIISHSMGGLLVRCFLSLHKDVSHIFI